MELLGKTAIITGSSGQLGSRMAVCLAAKGLNVLCHYGGNEERAVEAADEIKHLGRQASLYHADLSKPGFESKMFTEAHRLGPVRVIVNSASVFTRQPVGTFSPQDVADVLAVNVTAPAIICNEFAKYLKIQGIDCKKSLETIGTIINMADIAGLRPWASFAPYCASRGALITMTKSLAKELAPAITVNAIAPGIVTWPGKMDPSEEEKQLKLIPAGRFGSPTDITRTIEFLLDSDYITGQVICVDGGRSI